MHALLGLAVAFVAIALSARPDLRQAGEDELRGDALESVVVGHFDTSGHAQGRPSRSTTNHRALPLWRWSSALLPRRARPLTQRE